MNNKIKNPPGKFQEDGINLLDLPSEILNIIFDDVSIELSLVNKCFFIMYNEKYSKLFKERFESTDIIFRSLKYLINYIKSFDYWRKCTRMIISDFYKLPEWDGQDTSTLEVQFIKDSWKLIYGIFINKRIFLDYDDYSVINESIKLDKSLRLSEGYYNFSCGLIIKNLRGVSSTIFKIEDGKGNKLLEYQPVSNLSEILPMDKFILLDMGSFAVKKGQIEELNDDESDDQCNNLVDIRLFIEELDVMIKSGFIICYIDINKYQDQDIFVDLNGNYQLYNDRYWFAWWIENLEPNPNNVVNHLLKRLYLSIDGDDAYDDSEYDLLDVENYNWKFYNKVNQETGEFLKREFKFKSQIHRRKYEAVKGSSEEKEDYEKLNEPLKWRMSTILNV